MKKSIYAIDFSRYLGRTSVIFWRKSSLSEGEYSFRKYEVDNTATYDFILGWFMRMSNKLDFYTVHAEPDSLSFTLRVKGIS